jgi:thymidylate kinase
MIVEFLGPPCTGKTTLLKVVGQRLHAAGIEAEHHNARRKPPSPARALNDPRIAAWYVTNPRLARGNGGRLMLQAIAATRPLRGLSGVHMIDEGPMRIPWVLDQSRLPKLLISAIPRADLAVLVDCDPHERLRRVRAADRKYARTRSDKQILAGHNTHLVWGRRLTEFHGVPLFEVDTTDRSDCSDEVVDRILETLSRLGDTRHG